MNLTKGMLRLFGTSRKAQYWPLGPPVRRFVGANAAPALVEGKPCIEFSDGKFATDDPAIAAGMVEDPNFDRPWGFFVDDGCLPDGIRSLWADVDTTTKRELLLQLIAGVTETQALDSVEITERMTTVSAKSGLPDDLQLERICPVQNCGAKIPAGAPMSVMAEHIGRMHPDWDPSS